MGRGSWHTKLTMQPSVLNAGGTKTLMDGLDGWKIGMLTPFQATGDLFQSQPMTDPFNEEAARLAALDLFPGRKWEDLTDGEREKARQRVMELRRILGEKTQGKPNEGH